jgi:hypothetical protein
MNFVELVDRLRVECGVSGSTLSSVQNLGGELNRLKTWIDAAWFELQVARTDWKFMRADVSFSITAGKQKYTPTEAGVPLLKIWKQDSFWIEDISRGLSDQQPLGEMQWEHFREMYVRGVQTAQRPMCYTVHPDKSLWFGPLPDTTYNMTGEAWLKPSHLVADDDTPVMPEDYHMVIVYEAMKKYAGFESANDVMTRARGEGPPIRGKLEQEQLPDMTVDGGMGGWNG